MSKSENDTRVVGFHKPNRNKIVDQNGFQTPTARAILFRGQSRVFAKHRKKQLHSIVV
jgi:hypothetical protein